jgi:hypothetical protein
LKWYAEVRQRMLLVTTGEQASPFNARAFLFYKPQGEKVSHLATVRLWEVGMTRLKNGLCAPAVPEDFDTAILQVSKFQLTKSADAAWPRVPVIVPALNEARNLPNVLTRIRGLIDEQELDWITR